MAGRGLHRRALRRSHRVLQEEQRRQADGAGHRRGLCRVSAEERQILGDSAWKATPTAGPIARTGSRIPRKRPRSRRSTATISACRRTTSSCATSPSSSIGPTRSATAIALYTDNTYDALAMGVESTIFSWGGELGDYSTYKVRGIINSKQNIEALKVYKELYKFTPPGWGKVFFLEDNQAITEGSGRHEHELLRLLPGAGQSRDQQARQGHGLLRQPRRTRRASASRHWAGRASRSSATPRSATRP